MLVFEVGFQLGQQGVTFFPLLFRLLGIREDQIFPKTSPEQVLHEAHFFGLRAQHGLDFFDHPAILREMPFRRLSNDMAAAGLIFQ